MQAPDFAHDEPIRLAALQATNLLNSPVEERFERITRLARSILGTTTAAVSLVDANRQWFKSAQGHDIDETTRSISFCGHVILQEDVFIVPDARNDPRFADNPLVTRFEPPTVFYAGCPLSLPDGSCVGSLCVTDPFPRELTDDQIRSLKDLASLVEHELSMSIAASPQWEFISQLNQEQRRAMVDPLTRLWNRQGVTAVTERFIEHARRELRPLGTLVIDLDDFRMVNDRYGHDAGDAVLREVGARLLCAARDCDVVGRIDGDQFAMALAPGITESAAAHLAERIRETVRRPDFTVHDNRVALTVSMGAALFETASIPTADTMIAFAAERAKRAKASGRSAMVA